jgi:hypothetical protein
VVVVVFDRVCDGDGGGGDQWCWLRRIVLTSRADDVLYVTEVWRLRCIWVDRSAMEKIRGSLSRVVIQGERVRRVVVGGERVVLWWNVW